MKVILKNHEDVIKLIREQYARVNNLEEIPEEAILFVEDIIKNYIENENEYLVIDGKELKVINKDELIKMNLL